mgnify:CR=1 FL=1
MTPKLDTFRRIVVKIGSALVVDQHGLKTDWLDALGADLAALAAGRRDLLVVSSGAIATGSTDASPRRKAGTPFFAEADEDQRDVSEGTWSATPAGWVSPSSASSTRSGSMRCA